MMRKLDGFLATLGILALAVGIWVVTLGSNWWIAGGSVIAFIGFVLFWNSLYNFAQGTAITLFPRSGVVYRVISLTLSSGEGVKFLLLRRLDHGPTLYFRLEAKMVPKYLEQGDKVVYSKGILKVLVDKEFPVEELSTEESLADVEESLAE